MRSIVKQVSGLSFALVAKAMEQTNVCSYIRKEYAGWLMERGLHNRPSVAVATHSGGKRNWWLEESRQLDEVPFFPEETFNGGWYHFQEADVRFMEASSATSGSQLTALKNSSGSWTLKLEVPAPCRHYDWGQY